MFKAVMKSLADAGHQVDVVSHFPLEKPSENYTDIIDLSGTLPMMVNNLPYEMMKHFGSLSLKTAFKITGTKVCELLELPEMQELIKNPPTDRPYDLVITEFFMADCYLAFGRHLKVPIVGLTSITPMIHANRALGNPHNTAIVSEIYERPISHMSFWQRLKNTIYVACINLQADYFMSEQNDIVKKHFGPEMPDVKQLEQEVSLNLVNSHIIFHNVRPLTPAIVEVAGIHVHDDQTPLPTDLKKWLDDSKNGFIYFSFGSMAQVESFPEATLAEIYKGLSQVAPLRVLMKVSKPEDLPPGLPENVFTLTWAPQVQILKHKNIRGFLTHGGLMGLQEAVTFAVPLIGVPLFADQIGNIGICVERGIAVSLDYKNLGADKIVAAITAIVYDPKYKNNMNAISKQFLDRPRSPQETAVFWIEYILKHGGEALRSPAINLTWWQLALIDVYGSLIAATLILLYVIKILLSTLLGRIIYSNGTTSTTKKRN